MTRDDEARLLAVADEMDAAAAEAHRWAGCAHGTDDDGSSVGGWVNNPFAQRLSQVAVNLRDAIAAVPR